MLRPEQNPLRVPVSMQFNAVFSTWSAEAPFVLHAGDTIRTRCDWQNSTTGTMTFPREMCIGVGFALTMRPAARRGSSALPSPPCAAPSAAIP
jgi:hypothetical protein